MKAPPLTANPVIAQHFPRFVSRAKAAEILGVHADTVSRLLREGVIPGRRLGRRWVVSLAALEAMATP